ARCGYTLIGRPYTNKKKDGTVSMSIVNYICSNRSQRMGCNLPLLRQSLAENLIMEHIRGIKLNHEKIMSMSESGIKKEDLATEADHLKKELKLIAERRKKWQYMFV